MLSAPVFRAGAEVPVGRDRARPSKPPARSGQDKSAVRALEIVAGLIRHRPAANPPRSQRLQTASGARMAAWPKIAAVRRTGAARHPWPSKTIPVLQQGSAPRQKAPFEQNGRERPFLTLTPHSPPVHAGIGEAGGAASSGV